MKIFIINNTKMEMSYEDLLEQFEPMLHNRCHRFLNDHRGEVLLDYDDVLQYARVALWKAMSSYDIEKNTHFSTHLNYQIIAEFKRISKRVSAEFRSSMYCVSTDNLGTDEDAFIDLSEEDINLSDFETIEWIDNLDFTKAEQEAIEHILSGRTLEESAAKYNLKSKQAMDQRVKRLTKKLKTNIVKGVRGYDIY